MSDLSIYDLAAAGETEHMAKLLDQYPDLVNQDDLHGWPPIFHAALYRQYDTVKLLLEHGADLSVHDGYVLHYAAEVSFNKRIVRLLLQYGVLDSHVASRDSNSRQFIAAIFLADERRVVSLLRVNPELVRAKYARGETALHHACRNGDLTIVKTLIQSGADVNAMSESNQFPLFCAAGHGHADVVKLLLENGADIQLRLSDGKNVIEWLQQFAATNARFRACLDLIAPAA